MKVIKEGAEAKLFLTDFEGRKAVLKKRVNKRYRNKVLDNSLIKKRTRQEYSLLNKANNYGVRVPLTYSLDVKNGSLLMEFIDGLRLKDYLNKGKNKLSACKKVGKSIARLHKSNIIQGDLTTSNFIINNKNGPVILDFGLGQISPKIEDKATDLLNLKKTFLATHSSIKEGWRTITKEYCKNYKLGQNVLIKLEEIEKRARYK